MEVRFFSAPRDGCRGDHGLLRAARRSAPRSQAAQFSGRGAPRTRPRRSSARCCRGSWAATSSPGRTRAASPRFRSARSPGSRSRCSPWTSPRTRGQGPAHGRQRRRPASTCTGSSARSSTRSGRSRPARWGSVLSIQLVDLNGDGDASRSIGNRWHPDSRLNSFVLEFKDGKPKFHHRGRRALPVRRGHQGRRATSSRFGRRRSTRKSSSTTEAPT